MSTPLNHVMTTGSGLRLRYQCMGVLQRKVARRFPLGRKADARVTPPAAARTATVAFAFAGAAAFGFAAGLAFG